MPVNIKTASDAWLEGSARFEEWKQRFEAEWGDPLGAGLWGMQSSRMLPEEHAALSEINPQGSEAIQRIITGGAYANTSEIRKRQAGASQSIGFPVASDAARSVKTRARFTASPETPAAPQANLPRQ